MLLILAEFLVLALIARVVLSAGRFCGVQPSSNVSCSPRVAPFGPHSLSLTTPVLLAGSNAPATATAWSGSITSSPPLHSPASMWQPGGLSAMVGTDT